MLARAVFGGVGLDWRPTGPQLSPGGRSMWAVEPFLYVFLGPIHKRCHWPATMLKGLMGAQVAAAVPMMASTTPYCSATSLPP